MVAFNRFSEYDPPGSDDLLESIEAQNRELLDELRRHHAAIEATRADMLRIAQSTPSPWTLLPPLLTLSLVVLFLIYKAIF